MSRHVILANAGDACEVEGLLTAEFNLAGWVRRGGIAKIRGLFTEAFFSGRELLRGECKFQWGIGSKFIGNHLFIPSVNVDGVLHSR